MRSFEGACKYVIKFLSFEAVAHLFRLDNTIGGEVEIGQSGMLSIKRPLGFSVTDNVEGRFCHLRAPPETFSEFYHLLLIPVSAWESTI